MKSWVPRPCVLHRATGAEGSAWLHLQSRRRRNGSRSTPGPSCALLTGPRSGRFLTKRQRPSPRRNTTASWANDPLRSGPSRAPLRSLGAFAISTFPGSAMPVSPIRAQPTARRSARRRLDAMPTWAPTLTASRFAASRARDEDGGEHGFGGDRAAGGNDGSASLRREATEDARVTRECGAPQPAASIKGPATSRSDRRR
jgi:hypothetical protein